MDERLLGAVKLDLIFPALPPALDGIGDHTARLGAELANSHRVRLLTAQQDALPVEGAAVAPAFSLDRRSGIMEVAAEIKDDPPDWVILQYNQFSYGRWGLNPFVPRVLQQVKNALPGTRVAVLFHEDFVPVTSWKNALMTTWQRMQFVALGRLADVILFSIEHWVDEYASWFPDVPRYHLPVGSNIPRVDASQSQARRMLGLPEERLVVGVFGTLHVSRLPRLLRAGFDAARATSDDCQLLYVGPDGNELQQHLGTEGVYDAGKLSARGVSIHLSAMDLHLVPFMDGLSTRRGSFMAGLQHGVASVGTVGPQTDRILQDEHGKSLLLAPYEDAASYADAVAELARDGERRAAIASAGAQLYQDTFAWSVLSEKLSAILEDNQREVAVARKG